MNKPAKKCLDVALDALLRRPLSEAELRGKLVAREYDEADIDAAIAAVKEYRYINDEQLACSIARAMAAASRGFGPKIRQKLRRRGFTPEVVAMAMAQVEETVDELAAAQELVARKFPSFDPTQCSPKEKGRIGRFLAGRGFSSRAVWAALSRNFD